MSHRQPNKPSRAIKLFLITTLATLSPMLCAGTHNGCAILERIALVTDPSSDNVVMVPQVREAGTPRVPRAKFQSAAGRLVVEILNDDIVRFEWSPNPALPADNEPIYRSPLVEQSVHEGATALSAQNRGTILETPNVRVTINPDTLGFSVFDKRKGRPLATITPDNLREAYKTFQIDNRPLGDPEVEGLAASPRNSSSIDSGWKGQNFFDPTPFGNGMDPFNGGAPTANQMPVVFFHQGENNYGLLVDNPDKTEWWFDRPGQGKVGMWGDYPRLYLIAGADLPDIHQKFMKLQSYPDLMPKHVTGWGLSKFGYDNWMELFNDLRKIEAAGMPLPRHVYLDLPWFGETRQGQDNEPSRMGTVQWDRRDHKFPHPEETVKWLKDRGIEVVPISESYVDRSVPDYAYMEQQGYFVKNPDNGQAAIVDPRPGGFWKWSGGMMDWSNPEARDYWFRTRLLPLARMGIHTYWFDLGDPEQYPLRGRYRAADGEGPNQADNHNIYNNLWIKTVAEGYRRNAINERPVVVSRAMTIGPKSTNWSGDIDGDPGSLNAHLRVALDSSWAGQFFMMGDTGGFWRKWGDWHYGQLYTRWLVTAMRGGELPARVHVWDQEKNQKYVPTDVGEFNSNKAALEEREAMVPYYYSLMWDAHLNAAPIRSAPSFYFQRDAELKGWSQFIVGRKDLLIAVSTNIDENSRDVRLPAGSRWVNWDTHEVFEGGQVLRNVSCRDTDSKFRPPTFARAGAIFPRTEQERAAIERNRDYIPPVNHDFIVRVFPGEQSTSFRRFDSDGHSRDYERGAFRTTDITQIREGRTMKVEIAPSAGTYQGAPDRQRIKIELATRDNNVDRVFFGEREIAPCANRNEFDRRTEGYYIDRNAGMIVFKTGEVPVTDRKTLRVTLH